MDNCKKRFHYLARAVIFVNGKVLLAHCIGEANTFMPGGHIEHGENAKTALVREIEEELGLKAIVGRFVGAVEHVWMDEFDNHEINLLFEVTIPGLSSSMAPVSQENHLEFIWSRLEDLESHNLLPSPMITCLQRLEEGYKGYWKSSMEEKQ
jgi:8-oxo-dGTP diphosphatase